MLNYSNKSVRGAKRYLRRYRIKFLRNGCHPFEWLYYYEQCMKRQPKAILEIGVYMYGSSLAFLHYLESNKEATLTSVDPLHNRRGEFHHKDPQVEDRWFRVLSKSQTFMKHHYKKYSLIYIDGLHTTEGVCTDFENSLQQLEHGGMIILHDWGSKPLREAVYAKAKELDIGREYFVEHLGYQSKNSPPSWGIGVFHG